MIRVLINLMFALSCAGEIKKTHVCLNSRNYGNKLFFKKKIIIVNKKKNVLQKSN